MVILTNTSKSPRGVHDKHGRCVVIGPGQSKPVDLSESMLETVKERNLFETDIQHTAKKDVSADDGLDSLRKDAESLGVKVDKRWGESRLQSEIDKALTKDGVHGTDSGGTEG